MRANTFDFDAGEWLNDDAIRSVSLAARGLWADLRAVMHGRSPRGYLRHKDGQPLTATQIALLIDEPVEDVAALLSELIAAGVASRTDAGVIYDHRVAALGGRGVRSAGEAARQSSEAVETRQKRIAAIRANPPAELASWAEWWNKLHDGKFVHAGVGKTPSKAVAAAWLKAHDDVDRARLLFHPGQRAAIDAAIRCSKICRGGWFRLEVLLAGNNPTGEMIVLKLLDGAYAHDDTPSDAALRDQATSRLNVLRDIVKKLDRYSPDAWRKTAAAAPEDISNIVAELGGWSRYLDARVEWKEREFVRLWIRNLKQVGVA